MVRNITPALVVRVYLYTILTYIRWIILPQADRNTKVYNIGPGEIYGPIQMTQQPRVLRIKEFNLRARFFLFANSTLKGSKTRPCYLQTNQWVCLCLDDDLSVCAKDERRTTCDRKRANCVLPYVQSYVMRRRISGSSGGGDGWEQSCNLFSVGVVSYFHGHVVHNSECLSRRYQVYNIKFS